MPKRCSAHLFKAIFKTEELADNYMKTFHPYEIYQVYWCPAYPRNPEEGHHHVRNKTKRNQRNKRRRQ